MNLDTLIPLAGRYLIGLFFLIAPLILARWWFPRATRMLESIVWPVIVLVAAPAFLGAVLPYLIPVIGGLITLAVIIGVGIALYLTRVRRHQTRRPRGKRQQTRVQPVRRPASRRQRRHNERN